MTSRSGRQLSIPDEHALLLEGYMRESQLFREELTKKEERHQTVLAELNAKLDALAEKVLENQPKGHGSRKRKRCTSIPKQCRNDFRKMYKKLLEAPDFNGFDLNAWEASHENMQVYSRVVTAIFHDYGGESKCPWSQQDLKGACATYLKSLRDSKKRAENNGIGSHKQKCRRQGRLREKLEHRLVALETVSWDSSTKDEVSAVLTPEYTSSDESVYSQDEENGKECVSRYLVKHLPWERSRLTQAKQALDKVYLGTLSKRVRNARLPRSPHPQNSTRPVPECSEAWAVRSVNRFMQGSTSGSRSGTSSLVDSTPAAEQPIHESTPLRVPTPAPRRRPFGRGQQSPTY